MGDAKKRLQNRRYGKSRYRHDPAFRAQRLAAANAYRAKWLNSVYAGLYRELVTLRAKLSAMHEQVACHEAALEAEQPDRWGAYRMRRIAILTEEMVQVGRRLVEVERQWRKVREGGEAT